MAFIVTRKHPPRLLARTEHILLVPAMCWTPPRNPFPSRAVVLQVCSLNSIWQRHGCYSTRMMEIRIRLYDEFRAPSGLQEHSVPLLWDACHGS